MANPALITSGKVLLDSNILVYVSNSYVPEFEITRKFVDDIYKSSILPTISTQNIKEAYRVLTHPTYLKGNKISDINGIVNYWLDNMDVVYEGEQVWYEYLDLLTKYNVKGNEIFDLWIVATMKANNIKTIITVNDKHFKKYRGIKVVNPLE